MGDFAVIFHTQFPKIYLKVQVLFFCKPLLANHERPEALSCHVTTLKYVNSHLTLHIRCTYYTREAHHL